MRYVLIITLLTGVALLVYWRLRPYLKMARNILGFVRDVRRMSAGGGPLGTARREQGGTAANATSEKLVRCSSCGTWLPVSRAVSIRSSKNFYCSHACLERSAGKEANAKSVRR